MPYLGQTFLLTERLLALVILLQTFELLQIKQAFTAVWNWQILQQDYQTCPKPFQKYLGYLLDIPYFLFILDVRIFLAILLLAFPHPLILAGLFLTTILICLRWRGTYNGGSDSMTLVILMALTFGSLLHKHSWAMKAAIWYIAIQVCFSYFIAGLVKIKNPLWRSGKALSLLVLDTNYETPSEARQLLRHRSLACILSWLILLFECSFPLALLHPTFCLVYIGIALFFHLGNFFVFGLNRFVFAWLMAYPALYWCSHLSKLLTFR